MRFNKTALLAFVLIFFSISIYNGDAQTISQKWQTTGNYAVGQSAYIGTADTTHISFGVNGIERARINNAGFFGVGNRNPTRPFVVQFSHPSALASIVMYNSDTTARNQGILSYRFNTTSTGASTFVEYGTVNCLALTHTNNNSSGALAFYVRKRNSTLLKEVMRIDSSLSVGIGLINPSQKLQVHGIVYTDSGGVKFPDGTIQTTSVDNSAWLLTGSSGTNPATNYLGTTDEQPLIFRVNSYVSGQLYDNTMTGNTSFGWNSLNGGNYGRENTTIGVQSLNGISGGEKNVAIGSNSLTSLANGSNNTFIGYGSDFSGGDFSNSSALGSNSRVDASNQVRIGDNNVNDIGGYSAWNNISDKRLKNVVSDTVVGLPFILNLHPVQYYWKRDSTHQLLHTGLLAQDVDSLANSMNFDFDGVVKPKIKDDINRGQYGMGYSQIVMPLIVAIQQQQKQIEDLKKQVQILINNK